MSTSRRKGSTPKRPHKIGVSFTNWAMGGSLLSLNTTSSLGSRLSSKSSRKSFDIATDDEEPPDLEPPAPVKKVKKKGKKEVSDPEAPRSEAPPPKPKEAEEKKAVCPDCAPEPQTPKCPPDCPICNEECVWEKHMHEKYGFMECDVCGRGTTWLKDEFHRGRGEYACEKCTPDCATCGRGPLWVSKKWQKTLKRRAAKLQGLEKGKKDSHPKKDGDAKKDGSAKKDKEDDSAKKTKDSGDGKAKDKGKEDEKKKSTENEGEKKNQGEKERGKEKDKAEEKSAEKDENTTASKDSGDKKVDGGKGQKRGHDWTSEEDAKLKELKVQKKSWKDIASELGLDQGLCKARFKVIEHSSVVTPDKEKDEGSGGDKQNADVGKDGDGLLGGLGGWDDNDSNQKADDAGGNGDNQGWGVTDTSNTNGDNSGNNGWDSNDNSGSNWNTNTDTNANATAGDNGNSSWGNNDSSDGANASGGDQRNSSWDNNNDTNGEANKTGDSANSRWDQNSNKTTDHSGGGNKQDKKVEFEGQITESNPTGYIPYRSASNSGADNVTTSPKTGNAETSGDSWGAQNDPWNVATNTSANDTGNAQSSGDGWGAATSDWAQKENGTNEPARDPWVQPDVSKDSGNDGAIESSNQPAADASNGWYTVEGSNLDKPSDSNGGTNWDQPQKDGITNQASGTDGHTDGNHGDNTSNDNRTGSFGHSNGPGESYSNNNMNSKCFDQGNNGFNSNAGSGDFNGGGNNRGNGGGTKAGGNFNQESQSRGRLRPTGAWSQDDCTKLEFLETKYREHKWAQMQADFYNWTGRMIHHELIEMKFKSDGYDT
ncbi:hypothetical protein VTL71DRAFT_16327 [Oculimacula yallundae]|uniref:Myb-like domain-containing protein n=1 Tax=Oculimacula yallundae TaxID=86028 RepID=A0ABR4CE47_9HELO